MTRTKICSECQRGFTSKTNHNLCPDCVKKHRSIMQEEMDVDFSIPFLSLIVLLFFLNLVWCQ